MNLATAKQVADSAIDLLCEHTERIEVAGSVRRQKPEVKDVELVVLPKKSFDAAMLMLVERNTFYWAAYEDKNGKTGYRKGPRYFGIVHKRMRVEVFTADRDNLGFIMWLRTGPADSNASVMRAVKDAPFRFEGGYGWLGNAKLALPDEAALFALLGLPFLEPDNREFREYARLLGASDHAWGDGVLSEGPRQMTLI